jgi:hypothetical protein
MTHRILWTRNELRLLRNAFMRRNEGRVPETPPSNQDFLRLKQAMREALPRGRWRPLDSIQDARRAFDFIIANPQIEEVEAPAPKVEPPAVNNSVVDELRAIRDVLQNINEALRGISKYLEKPQFLFQPPRPLQLEDLPVRREPQPEVVTDDHGHYGKEIKPPSTLPKKPYVYLMGLLPDQQTIVEREYSGYLRFRFLPSQGGKRDPRASDVIDAAQRVDFTVAMMDFANKMAIQLAKKHTRVGGWREVHGGLTSLRKVLDDIALK